MKPILPENWFVMQLWNSCEKMLFYERFGKLLRGASDTCGIKITIEQEWTKLIKTSVLSVKFRLDIPCDWSRKYSIRIATNLKRPFF